MPCSSARSCSSASARSSAVCGSAASRSRHVAPVDVQADVAPCRRGRADRAACRGSARAKNTARSRPDRRRPWSRSDSAARRRRRSAAAACSSSSDASVGERRDCRVDHLRLEQRLVSLDVDDDVAVERGGDFSQPIGAALMRRRRHHALRRRMPRTASAIRSIVGGDDHRARPSAPRRRAGRRARSSAGRRCPRAPCPEDGSSGTARG